MKKLLCVLLLAAVLVPLTNDTVEAKNVASLATLSAKSEQTTLRKRKGYRKKKGFMWGLFRKKNGCGCPKN
ncbi:MAG: hypothetical protein EAZ70_06295 [Runella slithyformis]|nr:MAG: hypothetical protein EAZ70_06295 [Runella slithyformis]TAF96286.1 MAG: hypothetical protein EAZ46_05670 [Runella sp.]TAG19796.1 MAG: hypothetical protein EAZ38_11685 [Cytophagales bacterium]TAG39434.1 MAG: hypothetical protein EAZ32_10095 [Cytophagia bacterium]TAF46757.1 MAG: hypothetical protein EAZ63_09020 [Runella slithyformis]